MRKLILIIVVAFSILKVNATTWEIWITSGSNPSCAGDDFTLCVSEVGNHSNYYTGNSHPTNSMTWRTGSCSGTIIQTVPAGESGLYISFGIGTTTTYYAVLSTGECLSYTLVISPTPGNAGIITGSNSVCQSQTGVAYSVSPLTNATSYAWSYTGTGATIIGSTNSIIINFSSTATIGYLKVHGVNSCGDGPTVSPFYLITVNPLPSATITPNGATSFCPNGSVTLSSSSATSYLWSNSETTQDITASASGNYTVTVTDANGCSAASSATTVTVNPLPTPAITVNGSSTFCQGANTSLNSNYANGNQWIYNGNNIPLATSQSYSPTQSGFYSLFVTDNNTCQATSSAVSITVNPSPSATITANGSTAFCQGDSVSLSVATANSYLWSNSATTQSITVYNSGNYSVTVTGANGCQTISAQTTVTVHNLPAVPTILQNGNVLMSSSSTNNQWYFNGNIIDAATSQFYTATESGFYSVTVTNSFGCSNSSTPVNINITGIAAENIFSDRINIYPNPATNTITLQINSEFKNAMLIIADISGRQILQSSITNQKSTINN